MNRKALRLVGTPVCWVRSGMGTETTSATYQRTQTHETQSISIHLPETKKIRALDANH